VTGLARLFREALVPIGWRTRAVAFTELGAAFVIGTLSTGEPIWPLVGAAFVAVPCVLAMVPPLGFERALFADDREGYERWRGRTLSVPLRFGLLLLAATVVALLADHHR
jgi:hypothetical protein